ncbi:unnamed protein product [Clonostachys byssicola]|uniref:Heterokaryon incompatibility domain-containing protein n=1 Tax=Clonostachys byssicola TaxID=160290 RepID=A0A9N9Y713_9HYPO|nr:unnamed protein product [Clonostachys byssicola]
MDQAGNVLCDKCQRIQIDDRVLSDYIRRLPDGSKYSDKTGKSEEILVPIASWTDYPPELPKLQESHVKTGCIFCKYLREAILLSKVEFQGSPIHIDLSHNWFNDAIFLGKGDITRDCNYSGIVGHVTDGEAKYGIYFSPASDDFQISQLLGIYSTPKPMALCEENVSWATNLLENLDHTSAAQDPDHGVLPTRLLDIGETGTLNPRLVSTSKETVPISYCALSYCWGPLPQLTTTKSTFQQYSLQGIPFQELTKVFKDAIEVCHTFGIRYLWIDSLCIIQDDPSDWERETTMMHQVYRNSYFTICALSSDSTHVSFLQRNQHRLELNFISSLDPAISGKFTLEFQGFSREDALPTLYRVELFFNEWSTRGWTFQEDEMSKRALYFTKSQLFFRTGDQYFTEDGWSSTSFRPTLRTSPTLENWYGKMLGFRKKKFANAQDVFPSLSGIVREYIRYHGDTYVAGHWKSDFLRGLLWHSVTYGLEEGRETLLRNLSFPRQYIAPSWSYLSRTEPGEHGINFHQIHQRREGHFRSMVESADAWTTPAGQDPYGRILGGTARIRGKVITCPSDLSKIHDDIFRTSDIFQIRVDGAYAATCQLDWPVNGDWESSQDLSLLFLASTCHRWQDGRPTTHYLGKQGNKDESGGSESSSNDRSGRSDSSQVGESTQGEHGGSEQQPFAIEESTGSLELLSIKEPVASEIENKENEGISRCCESGCAGSSPQLTGDKTDSDLSSSETSHELCPVCGHCMKCCTSEVNRHAWGLIIHPALEPGKYFRVGVFTSRSDGPGSNCGTRLFDQADHQEIDII